MQVTDEMVRVAARAMFANRDEFDARNSSEHPAFEHNQEYWEGQARAALTAALAAMWRPIEEAPMNERVLVYNELWDETHGAHQIAMLDSSGNWQFDSELCVDDITEDDIEASEDEPLSPEDFKPQKWRPLPSPPTREA